MNTLDFVTYTTGLLMHHENLVKPKLVKLEILKDENNSIILRSVSARNLNRIFAIKDVILSAQEYQNFVDNIDVYDELNSFDLPLFRVCGFYLSSKKA